MKAVSAALAATIIVSVASEPAPAKRYPAVIEATVPTPWDSNFEFDRATFAAALNSTLKLTRHVYIFDTAGEGYAVTDKQFRTIARAFASEMKKAGALSSAAVGLISMSLGTVQERIEFCQEELGIRVFQLTFPSWGALTDAEVLSFFEQTAGRYNTSKFIHYNNPLAKRTLNATLYSQLAARHSNFVAVKTCNNDPDWLEEVATRAPELQLFPNEAGFALTKERLHTGLLISTASTNFEQAKRFFRATGKQLQAMGRELPVIDDALTAAVGPLSHMDGAYDKILSRLHIPNFPLRLLPPYSSPDDAAFTRFVAYLKANAPQWLPASTLGLVEI